MAVPSSPSKDAAPSILQSPARRPPSSPFKDAMKSSPKKMNLADGTPRPALLFPKDAVQSTMKDSPKRGIVPVALAQPVFLAKSPTKTSLLQSPARRPGVTPMKAFVQQSPTKSSAAKPFAKPIKSPKRSSPSKTPESSPQEAASSPLRAARTVQSPIKVHTITEADRVADAQTGSAKASSQGSFDFFIEASKRTPVTHVSRGFEEDPHDMMSQNGARSPSPSPIKHHPSAPIAAPVVDDSMPDEKEVRIPEERSTTPPGPIAFVAPAFSLASPVFRCAVDESDSEDELASPQKVFLSTPLHKHGVATQDFGAQPTSRPAAATRRSSHRSSANRKSFGMSPLAVQMSAWLASSPEKIDLSDSAEISQPVTSPTRSTFQESPAKTSFFEDQMVVCDGGNDTVIDAEMAEVEVSQVAVETSQESKSFEEYGDENVMPEGPQLEPQLVALQQGPQERTVTCTPAKVFYAQPRDTHSL